MIKLRVLYARRGWCAAVCASLFFSTSPAFSAGGGSAGGADKDENAQSKVIVAPEIRTEQHREIMDLVRERLAISVEAKRRREAEEERRRRIRERLDQFVDFDNIEVFEPVPHADLMSPETEEPESAGAKDPSRNEKIRRFQAKMIGDALKRFQSHQRGIGVKKSSDNEILIEVLCRDRRQEIGDSPYKTLLKKEFGPSLVKRAEAVLCKKR